VMSMFVSVCVCVCLSVHEDISRNIRAIFTNFFVHIAYVHGSVLLRHVYDRPHRLSPGRFSSLWKMHYRLGKGDGSAQRRQSMLSMIALCGLCMVTELAFVATTLPLPSDRHHWSNGDW